MATKYNVPLKLTQFTIETSKNPVTVKQLKKEFSDMINHMEQEERTYLNSPALHAVTQDILNGHKTLKRPMNACGRTLNIEMVNKYSNQPYNMSEMFRTSVVQKLFGHVQSVALFSVLNNYATRPTVKEVADDFTKHFPSLKKPVTQVITAHIHRRYGKGTTAATIPTNKGILNMWACDTHHSKLKLTSKSIFYSIPSEIGGRTTLKFKLPKSARFQNGTKATRPTIYRDDKGQVVFVFTIEKPVPKRETSAVLGVDLGIIENFVATSINEQEMIHSAPYHTDKKVNKLKDKLNNHYALAAKLKNKRNLCLDNNRVKKAQVLETERLRVIKAAKRIKSELATLTARNIVEIADKENANIILEQLNWAKSGKWHRSEVQDKTEHLAKQRGLGVKKVSARGTSQKCSECNGKVKHSKRASTCVMCLKRHNRDANSSKNIALKKTSHKNMIVFKQRKSALTRVSYPTLNIGPQTEVTLTSGVVSINSVKTLTIIESLS